MSEPIIKVEGLGKKYRLHHQAKERYTTLRDVITRKAKTIFSPASSIQHQASSDEDFWALKDLNFEIQQGEVVGIIGRNGAGKSTLLKILSRITEPTTGRITLRGRVASLLEVGTGFHPELTGRENIFLNGAILGMNRMEIKSKFDEIVAFAEVEKFLDTPVKHYSSGMYVRLAFAVAAHLEPEILVVDEVLAVGDVEFQKKCLGKMQDIAVQGRTVLFVSHNMEAIDRLTSRCLALRDGGLVEQGITSVVVSSYLKSVAIGVREWGRFRASCIPNTVSITDCWTESTYGERRNAFRQGEPFNIVLRVKATKVHKFDLAVVIENHREQALFTTHASDTSELAIVDSEASFVAEIRHPALRRGTYLLSLAAFSSDRMQFYDSLFHLPMFEIAGSLDASFPDDIRWGDLYHPISWHKRDQ